MLLRHILTRLNFKPYLDEGRLRVALACDGDHGGRKVHPDEVFLRDVSSTSGREASGGSKICL